MRIAQLRSMDVSNGEEIGVSLWCTYCPYHCLNCYNSELWGENVGRLYTQEDEDKVIELMKPDYVKRFSMLGGEPLVERNHESLLKLFSRIKKEYPNKKIWCWTGSTFEKVKDEWKDVLVYVDFLCDGPYIHELRDPKLRFVGSSNQRVLELEQSFHNSFDIEDVDVCIYRNRKDK